MIGEKTVNYEAGQTVEVFAMGGWQNHWRRAVLLFQDKPYRGQNQWEYRWESGIETNKETGVKPPQGGRTLEQYIRPARQYGDEFDASTLDTHKLGTCLRFANGETCVGCGDAKNGEVLPDEV